MEVKYQKYHPYPENMKLGVDLLGQAPVHWGVWKFKHVLAEPMVYGANEAALDDNRENSRYIRITDMNADGSLKEETFRSLPMEAAKGYLLNDGDILLARTGATVGKSFIYKKEFGPCCFAGYLIRARCNRKVVLPQFVYWFCQSDLYQNYIASSQIQATIQNVSAEKYGEMAILLPQYNHDQFIIINFLDHETAKIDTLIDKQQQLIKLLKEKRQAVISHAVTKGLNPAAPMKDSGVEWLGEVPEHWVVTRAKYVSDIFIPQRNKPELNECDGLCWVTMEDMKTARIGSARNFVSESAMRMAGSKKLQHGSVIASCVGNFGIASINDVDVVINQQLQAFIPNDDIEAEYLRLQVTISKSYFEIVGTSATLVYVNQEGFENLPIILPPLVEQKRIVVEVASRSETFSYLIEKSENAIALMQERRTALISAAVTGKIDVRNWQPAG